MPRQNKIILRNGTTVPNGSDFDTGEPAWDKNAGTLYVKNSAGAMVAIGGSFTGGTLTSGLIVASGTTSLAPLSFQAGTNLTTAASGVIEYDGTTFYSTPAGRGISPSVMVYRLNADLAGANSTASQSLFGVGVSLQANTIYAMQMVFTLAKTAGTTSHSVGFSFDGGTATFNNIHIQGMYSNHQAAPSTTSSLTTSAWNYGIHTGTALINYINNIAGSVRTQTGNFNGTFSVNAAGTFNPQYKLSAAPGGAYSTLAGSFISIWPIGTAGSNVSVGPWA
jgi:hypothetical protein